MKPTLPEHTIASQARDAYGQPPVTLRSPAAPIRALPAMGVGRRIRPRFVRAAVRYRDAA
jgi:hypothetical protein